MVKKQTRPYLTGPYARHVMAGVGYFIQRERPEAVVEAVLQLARSKN
jgi:pimeloyl-ACP methyl ester carboxylesterase